MEARINTLHHILINHPNIMNDNGLLSLVARWEITMCEGNLSHWNYQHWYNYKWGKVTIFQYTHRCINLGWQFYTFNEKYELQKKL